jgi:segregation and condensation protein B
MRNLRQQIAAVTARNRCSRPPLAAAGGLVTFCRAQYALRRLLVGGGASISGAGMAIARRSRLEAVLFLAREPLSLRKLAQLANLADGTEARTVLKSLRDRYDERGCAFQVAQVAGGYQLLSRREFARWLRPRSAADREIRLSPPSLETLAVVAYRQPVLRAEVEAIRGVACGEILRQLLDRDLLRIVGRSEELGRPLRYGTTKRFLEVFGLCNLDQLPWSSQLRRTTITDESSGDSAPGFSVYDADLTCDGEAA